MTREERDAIVIPLLNKQSKKKKAAKKRKPEERPPDAKVTPVPKEAEKSPKSAKK